MNNQSNAATTRATRTPSAHPRRRSRLAMRLRRLLLAATLAGGTVFDLGTCFQDWVEDGVAHQECLEEYGHKPDFVEAMCFDR